ncbi:phosphoglycolate phosphatase [Rhodobacter sp. SGA-6-6]|uniref:phosphoglycolate phosphatase n=1 Tax=Rhodobacter sp. SGA-6-6 TaxID=2710882 RepID=UPI0013EB10B1|nr:phosphoglycolate phosphatase [Rhodobacter sp. SGA-6-6]NGM45841.1 phosphoglycolate phosphatase [Rhodobacter sp. SGA-6-6]
MILVFDLDGTLVDSAPDIRAAVNRMLAGLEQGPMDLPTIIGFVGNGMPKLVERVMAARGIDPGRHGDLTQVTLDHYAAAPSALTRPYPGAPQALAALEAAGHRLAVCTNKPEAPARAILADLGLARHFPVVVGGDSLPVRKPDPAPALACVEAHGGGAAAFVGDSEVDAETAAAAGLPFYLFTRGYRKSPVEALPHRASFSDFAELPGLIG